MPSLVERITKPIFIVGSGRSGSTILTWCLGQHPNIIPQEESDWLGPFAIDAAAGYERGTARLWKRAEVSVGRRYPGIFLLHLWAAQTFPRSPFCSPCS